MDVKKLSFGEHKDEISVQLLIFLGNNNNFFYSRRK